MTDTLTSLFESYKDKNFLDSTEFKKFLSGDLPKTNAEYELVNKIVDDISFIRFNAEEEYKKKPHKAHSKRKALPIPWKGEEGIEGELTKARGDEPPRRIITTIAQRHFSILKSLTKSLKTSLQREREKVRLSAVQQLDSYCIRWLTKQSENSIPEKAGNAQKIYAVVRKENIDTLENQVLKDFLKRILPNAAEYLRKYQKDYPTHPLVIAVKSLGTFCKEELCSSAFKSISNLKNSVAPNYTLQYHPLYSVVWESYRLLLHKTQLAELVWKYRYNLFAEYFGLSAFAFFNGDITDEKPIFTNEAWITFFPEGGRFFTRTSFFNVFSKNDSLFEAKIDFINGIQSLVVSKNFRTPNIRTTRYVPIYIPSSFGEDIILPDDGNVYVAFNASSSRVEGNYVLYNGNFDYERLVCL